MLKLYNTLTRKIESFSPINAPDVGVYSCGPTVYDYQHIGHMRRYLGDDLLVRVLNFDGYKVKHVMNITDVGHLTSDADTGQDKMEKGVEKYGGTVWDIAQKFEKQFFDSTKLLNIQNPDVISRATENIQDQIDLVRVLEEKGFTYKIEDGIYFDVSKFPDYNKLSKQPLEEIKEGARIGVVKGKKHSADFALWKFSPKDKKRQMEWESPWGKGFPGWHIECSAMSMKALGLTIDIHTGGIDHINVHHTNEIAQSEAATGRKFVNFWIHHGVLLVDGEKMSKSLENTYTVEDLTNRGFDPLALRYLFLQTHYRQEMNFTFESLKAAQVALRRLRSEVIKWDKPDGRGIEKIQNKFFEAINDDLNIPQALSFISEVLRTKASSSAKAETLFKFDEILGLGLKDSGKFTLTPDKAGSKIAELVSQREKLRKQKKFHLADQLRGKIKKLGFEAEDSEEGTVLHKIIR